MFITYLQTREGWLYLAVVLDLGSRQVVGRSMAPTMRDDLVIAALESALTQRRPRGEVLFHSDRGSQYASADFRALARRHGLTRSMSGKGGVLGHRQDVARMVKETVMLGREIRQCDKTVFEFDFQRVIGNDRGGNSTSIMRAVFDGSESLITAYPIPK